MGVRVHHHAHPARHPLADHVGDLLALLVDSPAMVRRQVVKARRWLAEDPGRWGFIVHGLLVVLLVVAALVGGVG